MKIKVVVAFSILTITYAFSSVTTMASSSETQLILERAGRMIASSFKTGNPDDKLFGLHDDYFPKRPSDIINKNLPVNVITTHSIKEVNGPSYTFKGIDQYKTWLKSVRNGFRIPGNVDVRTMSTCIDGCCNFPLDGGISHNKLYLSKACFILENGKPFLKSLTLLDGD